MARLPFRHLLIADLGISFGDEGKGRLIPEVIADLRLQTGHEHPVGAVFKVNGGANAGHSVADLKLNLIPSGVVDAGVPVLALGAGVVADPRKLTWEATYVELHGYELRSRLLIDERTMVSDLCHRLLDLAAEAYRTDRLGLEKRGSTGRGITPAFMDETGQQQIFYADFLESKDAFAAKLRDRAARAVRTIQHVYQVAPAAWDSFFTTLTSAEQRANAEALEAGKLSADDVDFTRFAGPEPFTLEVDAIIDAYWKAGQVWREQIGEVREALLGQLESGHYVIAEFGQAYWLDKRFGFSPNLTASHTFTPELFQSANIPLQPVHGVGVAKAYDTKVGTHRFHTIIGDDHPLGKKLRTIEFGTSTGRQRAVGWYDAVEKGESVRYGGVADLMINKLDALTYSGDWQGGELLICVGYRRLDGTMLQTVPRRDSQHVDLVPVYRQYAGWSEDISQVRRWAELPENARRYVAALYQHTLECAFRGPVPLREELPNLRYLGVGPQPSQLIHDVPPPAELLG